MTRINHPDRDPGPMDRENQQTRSKVFGASHDRVSDEGQTVTLDLIILQGEKRRFQRHLGSEPGA